MQGALKYGTDIDEPRLPRNQKHPFFMLIGTTLLASLSGIDSLSGFVDFTEAHDEQPREYFDVPFGYPSHDTYQRLWDVIAPSQSYKSCLLFTASLKKLTPIFCDSWYWHSKRKNRLNSNHFGNANGNANVHERAGLFSCVGPVA